MEQIKNTALGVYQKILPPPSAKQSGFNDYNQVLPPKKDFSLMIEPVEMKRDTMSNGSAGRPTAMSAMQELKVKDREERSKIVLWKMPFTTMRYFLLECFIKLVRLFHQMVARKRTVFLVSLCIFFTLLLCSIEGPHTDFVYSWKKEIVWCGYWVGLGILSSVGLGTGLHTFLLYLGPHIASVTLAAFECKSLDFPEPPYPEEILCPESADEVAITLWKIMGKVRLEAFMWGAGTAIGELPPYFMARAATLSGIDPDDEDYEEATQMFENVSPDDKSLSTRMKLFMKRLVEKAGFFGIMAAASIPNPLFDLAGITCGHFLVPFWTFFGATLIGKAVIKMHIQKLFIIISFSKHHVELLLDIITYVPLVGTSLQAPFKDFLEKQREKLHSTGGETSAPGESWLKTIFEYLILAMVLYFLVSIINAMAQSYKARLQKKARDEKAH